MRLPALVCLAFVSFALLACSPRGSLLDYVASSAEASEGRGTVRFEMESKIDSEDDYLDSEISVEGAIDFENELLQMVVNADLLGDVEAIVDGDTMYMKFGLIFALFGVGDEQWISMSVEDAWEEAGLGSAARLGRTGEIFRVLKTSAATVTEEGSETIRGVDTTHYVLLIDSDEAANREAFQGFTGLGSFDFPAEFTVDAWIDGDELVRRLSYAYEVDAAHGAETTTYHQTLELFDYGEPVDIALPHPDEVMDMDEWLESLEDMDIGAGLGGDWDDPFDGAECYGDRLAECFEPNPDLADLYGDPADCAPYVRAVCLAPVGYVRRDVVEAVLDFHRQTAGVEITVLPSVPIDPANVDMLASQGLAEALFEDVKAQYSLDGSDEVTVIGLASIDLRPDDGGYGWYFGFRTGWDGIGHMHGMFSYFRMVHVEPYDGRPLDDQLLYERVAKYMGRYVALLHMKWPTGTDIAYLNYHEMYGFGDLDSMGTNWPEGSPPCLGEGEIICIVPDGLYFDDAFEDDLRAVLVDLEAATGLKVELRLHSGAYPTYDPWSDEYRSDLYHYMTPIIIDTDVFVIGVTDDPFADDWDLDRAINPHITRAWPEEQMAVASGFNAGTPGTGEHRERLFRILLRAVELARGTPESGDPLHLLYSGHARPADLDAVTAGLP